MAFVALLLLLALAYAAHGSLEEFPTVEQMDKVRTVAGLAAAVLIALEAGLWCLLRRVARTAKVGGRVLDGGVPPAE